MRFLIVLYLCFACVFAAEAQTQLPPITQDDALTLAKTFRGKVHIAVSKNHDIAHYLGEAESLMTFANYSQEDAINWVTQASSWIEEQESTFTSLTEGQNLLAAFTVINKIYIYERLQAILQQLIHSLNTYKATCEQLSKGLGLKNDAEFGSPKQSDGESSDDEG